jgi:TolA-binding protein
VGNHRIDDNPAARTPTGGSRRWLGLLAGLALAGGCQSGGLKDWMSKSPAPPPAPVDSMVLRAGHVERQAQVAEDPDAIDLEGARRLYQQGEHAQAEKIFARIADNTKNPPRLAEEARYYQADCARLQGYYPRAAELYVKQLQTFPTGKHGALARQRMFDIANYWLDDTREVMEAYREKKEGKRTFVWPVPFINLTDKTKPKLDIEGYALRLLDQVFLTDPGGPLGEKALFYLGSVRFFREDWHDADHYFHQVVMHYPNGALAPKALELSIVCKQMCTGGSAYDGRKVCEARELVQMAYRSYPELAQKRSQFLTDQLYSINQQQADKDYNIAEFYRRTGKPGPAYFMYEVVRRRYPGTKYAEMAARRMDELRERVERDKARQQPPAEGAPGAKSPPKSVRPDGSFSGPTPPGNFVPDAALPQTYTPGAPLPGGQPGTPPTTVPPGRNEGR